MKKIPLWKNIVLIFALIVTIIIATLAWFYNDHRGVVNFDLKVGEATYLQISGDGGNNWKDDIEVLIGVNQNFKEISGDGYTFYQPVYEVKENAQGVLSSQITAFERVTDKDKYFEQTFEIRSDVSQYIYLAPESYIKGINDARESNIDGAIRVAFFEVDETGRDILKFIWAPNSKTEYLYGNNTFTKDGNVEEAYYYQKTVKPVDVSTLVDDETNVAIIQPRSSGSCGACGYDGRHQFMWSCGQDLPDTMPALLKIDVPEGEPFGYKTLKIKVWLEGHDRECVNLLGRQKFTMNFQFDAERGE